MRRRTGIGITALGAAASLLLGTGLVSLLSDTVTSQGNHIESGTLNSGGGQAHDVRAYLEPGADGNPGTCGDDSLYQSDVIGASTITGFDGGADPLNNGTFQADNYCVKNFGTTSGRLLISFSNIVNTETGCSDDEGFVDTTCGSGDGELSSVLQTYVAGFDADGTQCASTVDGGESSNLLGSSAFDDLATSPMALVTLAPGESCELYLAYGPQAELGDAQLQVAQTDAIDWDIVFTLTDQPT